MKTFEFLHSYLTTQLSFDDNTACACESLFSFEKYIPGTQIIYMGDVSDSMHLVLKGLVRAYYIDENGYEITKCFAKENEWCGFYSFISEKPSPFFVETLEETYTAKIKTENIKVLTSKSSVIQEKVTELINIAFLSVDKKSYDFASKEAKERYIEFTNENPEIVRRVKQEYIASYLGITPSSLSRIKREINS